MKLDMLMTYHAQSISVKAWWAHDLYFLCCDFILYFKILYLEITDERQDVAKNWKNLGQASDKGHSVRNFLGLGIWTGMFETWGPRPVGI